MKTGKALTILLSSLFLCSAVGCQGGDNTSTASGSSVSSSSINQSSGIISSGTETPASPNRSGYIFCGYYEDEAFTKPVEGEVTESQAKNYYAKYQPDVGAIAEGKPFVLDWTIYSPTMVGALDVYLQTIYGVRDIMLLGRKMNFADYGIYFSRAEVILNNNRGLFTMSDRSKTIPYTFKYQCLPEYYSSIQSEADYIPRKNTWKFYVGETKTTEEGLSYFIVDNSFAVVVGVSAAEGVERLEKVDIPTVIEGKPVKEVSFVSDYNMDMPRIGSLYIPSCVDNVMLYCEQKQSGFLFESVTIEEGVKTVRMDSYIARNISLPASAYYVEFNSAKHYNQAYGAFMENQSVTVGENGHYYTENGCLYSKEGALCFQFGERENIELRIKEGTKRILPYSITGCAKNIYVPESVEELDLSCTAMGLRGFYPLLQDSRIAAISVPLYLINSQRALSQVDNLCKKDFENESAYMPLVAYKDSLTASLGAESGIDGYKMFAPNETFQLFENAQFPNVLCRGVKSYTTEENWEWEAIPFTYFGEGDIEKLVGRDKAVTNWHTYHNLEGVK